MGDIWMTRQGAARTIASPRFRSPAIARRGTRGVAEAGRDRLEDPALRFAKGAHVGALAVRLRWRPFFAAVAGVVEVLAGSPIRGDLQARLTVTRAAKQPPAATPIAAGRAGSHNAGDAGLVLLLLAVVEVVLDDDGGLGDGRAEWCGGRTTGGCRRKREKSLLAACLWMLAAEPDVDPARVPDATGAPIRRHRRPTVTDSTVSVISRRQAASRKFLRV